MPGSDQPRRFRRKGSPEQKQRQFRKRLRAYRSARGLPSRRIPRAAVPSFFTLMNLFSGFLALTQIGEGRYDYACWLIVLAGFFDALDGMMARLTNGQSLFGVELDSLSDIVSFGVAPSFLVYQFGLREFGVLGLIVSSLPAICGAVRLARFNITFDGDKKDYFSGLPIPGQAFAMVAIILNFNNPSTFVSNGSLSFLIPIVFVLSFLMISTIQFEALPKPSRSFFRQHPRKAFAFVAALILTLFWIPTGLLISLVIYLVYGIGRATYRVGRDIWTTPLDDVQASESSSQ